MTRTKIIPTNGKNLDDGYVIENPFATVQTFHTEDGAIEIPVYCLIQIFGVCLLE